MWIEPWRQPTDTWWSSSSGKCRMPLSAALFLFRLPPSCESILSSSIIIAPLPYFPNSSSSRNFLLTRPSDVVVFPSFHIVVVSESVLIGNPLYILIEKGSKAMVNGTALNEYSIGHSFYFLAQLPRSVVSDSLFQLQGADGRFLLQQALRRNSVRCPT